MPFYLVRTMQGTYNLSLRKGRYFIRFKVFQGIRRFIPWNGDDMVQEPKKDSPECIFKSYKISLETYLPFEMILTLVTI